MRHRKFKDLKSYLSHFFQDIQFFSRSYKLHVGNIKKNQSKTDLSVMLIKA